MAHKASKDEARALLSVPFGLTSSLRAPESGLRRVRIGESDGRSTWTFDVRLHPRTDSQGTTSANNYSAAAVQLPGRVDGRVALARRGFLRRAETAGLSEVEAGTDELRRRFKVRASSEDVAKRVLDDRACEWLAGPGRRFHYEIVHDRALAYGWRRYISNRGPLRAAVGLASHLSLPVESARRAS